MNAFLNSLRADLLDRRLRAVLMFLTAALIGALAYALTGGSGSTTPPALGSPTVSSVGPGIAPVAVAANPSQAVAETTSGSSHQRGGSSRDPFTPLPGSAKPAKAASSAKVTKAAPKPSGPSTGVASPAPAKPVHVVIRFHVSAEFGVVPPAPAAGVPAPAAQLTPYKDMKLNEALPSKNNAQLVYLGVVLRTGKDAVFQLTGEALIHGSGTCVPSPTHCQAIKLQAGQSETLEAVEANGTPVTYELKLISITRSVTSASAARAHVAARSASKRRRELARRLGLAPAGIARYSPAMGALVLGQRTFAAPAAGAAAPRGH
jgi:hypothetical protein